MFIHVKVCHNLVDTITMITMIPKKEKENPRRMRWVPTNSDLNDDIG